jgi:hypothetical protein
MKNKFAFLPVLALAVVMGCVSQNTSVQQEAHRESRRVSISTRG